MVIGAGLFLVGMLLYLLLESGVNYSQSQKRLTYIYMSHPRDFEITIHLLLLAFPSSFVFLFFPALQTNAASSLLSILVLFAMFWPFVLYQVHRRFAEFAITLGMRSEPIKEVNPVLKARLSLLGWILAVLSIVAGFIVRDNPMFQFLDFPLMMIGMISIVVLPLRKSIDILRGIDTEVREDYSPENTEI
jgi:hypothetical protein